MVRGALSTLSCALLLLRGIYAATPQTMRAVVVTNRLPAKAGDFSHVKLEPAWPVPKPGKGQVLIRVAASSVNPVDWKLLEYPLGLAGPKVLGFDVAGTIEAVGPGCERLKPGDAVWADLGKSSKLSPVQLGAWAEFALADESQVSIKPGTLDFASAAALPLAALTDYQALKKAGAPWAGRQNLSIVITSGSGGTGVPAIQLAKAYNASRITTAASSTNKALLQSLGATDVVDYHVSSIWDELPENSVDVVYDNYGAPGTADAAMRVLRPGGVFIFLPGKNAATSKHPKPGVTQIDYGLCDSSHHEDLDALAEIANAGLMKGVVQESFPLENITQALNLSFAGHVVGKVGVQVARGIPRAEFQLPVIV
eukprot:gb/GFBE01057709.1/.p1 GENE.gb/GFBE01057709.1/~~gb/GFBE01057709.1/.p1  ORF type:complete len:368 (+),score=64.22 gb/GFBE01057709.1/:1-1104(+)